jgi:hypothetical protein
MGFAHPGYLKAPANVSYPDQGSRVQPTIQDLLPFGKNELSDRFTTGIGFHSHLVQMTSKPRNRPSPFGAASSPDGLMYPKMLFSERTYAVF